MSDSFVSYLFFKKEQIISTVYLQKKTLKSINLLKKIIYFLGPCVYPRNGIEG
jgi:hypothetical protein